MLLSFSAIITRLKYLYITLLTLYTFEIHLAISQNMENIRNYRSENPKLYDLNLFINIAS
jgi:hypothetical protein